MLNQLKGRNLFLTLTLLVAGASNSHAAPLPDPFYKIMTRPVARVLFEGEGGARELVLEKLGKPITDFRSGDAYRFRMRFEGEAKAQLQDAVTRIEARLLEILRTGTTVDGQVLVRSLAEQELLPLFAKSGDRRFIDAPFNGGSGQFRSAREAFVSADAQLEKIVASIKSRSNLNGLSAPGVNLGQLTDKSLQLLPLEMQGADLRFSQIESTDLLGGADLRGAKLDYAMLSSSNLRNADLSGASLVGAELRSAQFNGTRIAKTNFSEADLRGVDLRYTRDWKDANFQGARYDERTRLPFEISEARARGMVFDDSILGRRYR
jgi:uncharacterized protein YjbI with pentapeptide repeats